jgi:hypothetical protein
VIALRTCAHCGNQYIKGRRGYCNACGNYLINNERLPEAHEMRKRHATLTLCTNCQQDYATTRKRGLCQACQRHLNKYGKPRSLKPKAKICARCREAKVYSSGLCSACYHYQNAHNGKKRPRHLWAEKRCRTCGRSNVTMTKGECRTCYEYRYLYGKDRPAHLWQRWNPIVLPRQAGMCHCKVCGKPAAVLFRQRCTSCYGYWWRNRCERPPHLWQRWAPHGWCDCGAPAVTTVTLNVDHGATEYKLCKECYEVEQGALR